MSFDVEVKRTMNAAFDAGDLAEFRRLLGKYPDYLLKQKDGTDWWMWMAAMEGSLPILQFLVAQGLDVNLSKDVSDPENPFCQLEGPILQAASEGHVDVVRWLLEQGAQINYTINGKVRCLPLLRAATNGHLDVAKLLVEHGADLNFTFNGHTPVSQAENYGHPEVAEYLRSVGCK